MKPRPGPGADCGPLRLLAIIRSCMAALARARRRAGRGHIADGLPSLREGALRCSVSWPVAELTSLAALATFRQAATSMLTKRAKARGQEACASRRRTRRCARTPPVALPAAVLMFDETHAAAGTATRHPGRAQRACEALRSAGLVARARPRALRELTRRVCSSAVSAANAASYAAGPQARAPQGSRSEAKTASPARWALPGCLIAAPLQAKRTLKDRNELKTDTRCVPAFHGMRMAQNAMNH